MLLPGQYVRVRLRVREERDALMAPAAALGSNQMGKFVYVVGAGDKAEIRPLELGPTDGALVSVKKGLHEGDRVIVGNLQEDRAGLARSARWRPTRRAMDRSRPSVVAPTSLQAKRSEPASSG